MPKYVVWRPDYHQTRENGEEFDARNPRDACEEWAAQDDIASGDYSIVHGQIVEVLVAEAGISSLPPLRYRVRGEAVAVYRATLLP